MGPEVRATGRATFTVRDEWEFLPALLRPTTATGHSCQHTVRQQEPHTPNLRKTNLSEDRRRATSSTCEARGGYGELRGYYRGYGATAEGTGNYLRLRGERHNILRLEALLQVSIPAYAQTRKRTLTQTPTSEQNPERPLSISGRKEEGSDLGSTRVPTYQHSYAYHNASYQPYRLPALLQQPTATDQRSEGSGSADEGLGLGSGQSNKVLQAHLRHARRLAALRRRLETLPSYRHSYVRLPAI